MAIVVRVLIVILIFLCWITNSVDCDDEDPCVCTSSGPCTLQCEEDQACQDATLICKGGETCDIICDGDGDADGGTQACDNANIRGYNATDVTLTCNEHQDCKSMNIECGTGTNKKIVKLINT